MAVIIYDGLNWLRDALETKDITLRQLYMQQFAKLPGDQIIWVWEGKGGNQRRRKEFPEYKMNRVRAHEDIFRSVKLFRDALSFAPVYQVQVDGYEGDDAVYSLVKWFREMSPVHVWSTDKDFRAFCGEGVTCSANQVKGVADCHVHLYKTLVGDPSDNIKGLKGFGHMAFMDCDAPYLEQNFRQGNFSGFIPELARIKPKHFKQLQEDESRIRLYWRITEFIEIPRDELAANLQLSQTVDFNRGMALFNNYLIA